MKKIVILTMALIMVLSSLCVAYGAPSDRVYFTVDDINDYNINTTTSNIYQPRYVVGKWRDGTFMYFTSRYSIENPYYGMFYTLNNGLLTVTKKSTNYVNSLDFHLVENDHPNKMVTFAWKPDDIPINTTYNMFAVQGTGSGTSWQTVNMSNTSTLFNSVNWEYVNGYMIVEHNTREDSGYGQAAGFSLYNNGSFDYKKLHAIEGTIEDMKNYLINLDAEKAGGNGITGIVNPTFTVKAGYALILELDGTNTLGISQTIDTNGYQASAPRWGKWNWGHYERFGNDLAFTYKYDVNTGVTWTKNGGSVISPAKTGYHVTDMGASTNYKYYMFANPPISVAAENNGNPGVPVTVRVNGTVKRSILYPLVDNWTEQSYTFDTNRTDVITYVDNNGELEQREVTGVDITGENPNITATTEQVGNITTQKELNYNDGNLIGGINDLLNQNNSTSNTITENFSNFFNNIRTIYTWLPSEVFNVCVGLFSIVLAIYVIKLFR